MPRCCCRGWRCAETYLNAAALTAAAVASGCDALHPGYGFLSENPTLPEACAAAGIVWVGPPIEAMRVMGHKARAKEVVAAAGVPVLPSAPVGARCLERRAGLGGRLRGLPLLVKASAGGGGRGMRLVEHVEDLAEAVASAQREAAAAFGSDEVFLERYLAAPRHVEVQVIGDGAGTVLHLFDRECSVQRRHQKVVEEAPAVLVPETVRATMWGAAVAAARAVGYVGVGTVEFLVDEGSFFFLEMNTRLQVEHGVTELVTGLDLVGLQLAVATGDPLPLTQEDVVVSGHAVEVRLCAERPREDYRPTPGTVDHVSWPHGPGLRVDRGVESGSTVSASYDSLVAKVMAHGTEPGPGRGTRCRCALRSLELDGLETNRDLLGAVLDDEAFREGAVDVHYLERRAELRDAGLPSAARRRHAAAAAATLQAERAARSLVPVPAAGWRNVGRAAARRHVHRRAGAGTGPGIGGPTQPIQALVDGNWQVVGAAETAAPAAAGQATVDLTTDEDGLRRRYRVRHGDRAAWVNGPEGQSTFVLHTADDVDERDGVAGECRAPLPGAVTKVLVSPGGDGGRR